MAAAIIKLNPLANAIGATAEDHRLGLVRLKGFAFAFVGGILIGCEGGKFGSAGVDGFVGGQNLLGLAAGPHR